MARARRAAAVAATVVAVTSACLPGVGGDDPSTTSAAPATPTKDPGRQLTEEEARLALPIPAELPSTFTTISDDPEPADEEQSSYPATCMDIKLDGQAAREHLDDRLSSAGREFDVQLPEGDAGYASVRVSSFDQPVPDVVFDDAGASVGACQTFSLIDKDGSVEFETRLLSTPTVGDRSFGASFTNIEKGDDGEGGVIELYVSKKGHNLITVLYSRTKDQPVYDRLSERVMRTTMENLEEP